jgi:Mg2+/Co2+ transporter CorC
VAAREAVGDIAGICERKPDVCTTGKEAMHTIAVRAKATVKIASEMMNDEGEAPDEATVTGSVPKELGAVPAKAGEKAAAKN